MTDKKELKDVWEEMEEIEPLTPQTKKETKEIIDTKVMDKPYMRKWRQFQVNLILRPLDNVNDPVWSVIITLIILLVGVSYYIRYILMLAFKELLEDGQNDPPKS